MAVPPSSATFLESFSEFAGIAPTQLNAKLAEAAARTNASVYATDELAQYAVMLRAAIILFKTPAAREMRLQMPDQATVWDRELKEMQRAATIGLRVFGTIGVAFFVACMRYWSA